MERVPPIELPGLLGVPVRIRCSDPDLADRLRLCYGRSGGALEDPARALDASLEPAAGSWRVRVEGRPEQRAEDAAAALRLLNHELLHGVMLRAPEHYYVHAGVVELGGRGLVLPGLSQAGKSTLVLALVQAGARLLSDELLAFHPATGRARAFPRAVKIRDACVRYFPELAREFAGTGETRFLPFESLGGEALAEEAEVALFAVPRWIGAEGEDELTPISRGEALLELARSSLNFGTHREESLDCLAALVHGTSAYRVGWRDPHAAAARLLAALGEAGG